MTEPIEHVLPRPDLEAGNHVDGASRTRVIVDVGDDHVATILLATPGGRKNLLSIETVRELATRLDELAPRCNGRDVKGVIVTAAPDNAFVAGADVNEIAGVRDRALLEDAIRTGQQTFGKLAALSVPTIAVINGPCMGGGTELVLACHYRLMIDAVEASIALPEVQLGICPAWGGSWRTARLLGLQGAADVVCSGRSFLPRKAVKRGLVDEAVPEAVILQRARDVIAGWDTVRAATELTRAKRRKGPLWGLLNTPPLLPLVKTMAARQIRKQAGKHYPAPLRALDLIAAAVGTSDAESALKRERETFIDLLFTDPPASPARHLLQIFLLSEHHRRTYFGRSGTAFQAVSPAGRSEEADGKRTTNASETGSVEPKRDARLDDGGHGLQGHATSDVPEHTGVLGAGLMGGGIAHLLASNGARVRLRDIAPGPLNLALKTAFNLTATQVKRGRQPLHEGQALMDRLSPTTDLTGFTRAGVVIEAVPEKIELKHEVYAQIEPVIPDDAILASNTSTLPITELAQPLKHPARFIGLHFFSPVDKMPLIEIIPGKATAPDTIERTFRLARGLGKVPILVRDAPGFLVNRLLGIYMNEAQWLARDGVAIKTIDRALKVFGMPMGPFELMDQVGLGTAAHASRVMGDAFADRMPRAGLLELVLERCRHNKRSGANFWLWRTRKGRRVATAPTPIVPKLIAELNSTPKPPRLALPDEAIVERTILPMINEASRILGEELVEGPDAIDAALIFGTGFPPFRGGLLRYADSLGLARVVDRLRALADGIHAGAASTPHAARFAPCEHLAGLAARNESYHPTSGAEPEPDADRESAKRPAPRNDAGPAPVDPTQPTTDPEPATGDNGNGGDGGDSGNGGDGGN